MCSINVCSEIDNENVIGEIILLRLQEIIIGEIVIFWQEQTSSEQNKLKNKTLI